MREDSARSVDVYVASVRDRLKSTLQEAQAQSTMEACQQKQYYNRKIGAVNLKPGDLVLVKVDAWKGKRKIKDRWEEETWEVVRQIAADVPSYEVTNQHGWSQVLHHMGNCHTWDRCTSPTPCKTTSIGGDDKGTHKRKLGRQSPNNLPVKLPWGGKMESCNLHRGCLLEHPLRMGEDHR